MRREGGRRQSGEEDQVEKPELVEALLPPDRRGLSVVPSGNTPQSLDKAEETPVWNGGQPPADGSPRVSPRDALGMLHLELSPLSLSILGTCG